MRNAAVCAVAVLAMAAASAACAQSTDVIGDLFAKPPVAEVPDEPDTAGQPPARPEPAPSLPAAPAQPSARPPRPQLTEPVHIEEVGKTPDAPPTVSDLAYDTRLRSSFASAQGFQGPLDGGWILAAQGGGDLYALQLVDRADRLEGAWRDLRRAGALDASGLVDDIQRTGGDLTLRLTSGAVAVLHGGQNGGWTGDLTEGARRRPVILRRSGP